PDFVGTSAGHNLIGVVWPGFVAGPNDLPVGTNPDLGPLQYNGGPTQTRAPASSSPVVDAGGNQYSLTTDQRGVGYGRNVRFPGFPVQGDGDYTDIGAVELQNGSAPT